MKNTRGRLRRTLAGLAGVAAIATMSLALTPAASAAPGDPTGDWGYVGSTYSPPPGSTWPADFFFNCLSPAGCDYSPGSTPGMQTAVGALDGGSLTPGTYPFTISGEGQVGTCTATSDQMHCHVTGTGHVPQGAALSAQVQAHVDSSTPGGTLVFQAAFYTGSAWEGNNNTNDIYNVRTPPEAGAPMADLGVAGGIGGAALLLSGAVAIRRRRRKPSLEPTA